MKLVADYLADAIKFERLAAEEEKPDIRKRLKKQAAAFRALAAKRAKKLGLPPLKSSTLVDEQKPMTAAVRREFC
jgi:hypothetical protein